MILIEQSKEGFVSDPNVLEYKYSLDGLVEDVESGLKNTNEYISELILLKDLILYLNDFEECMALQEKYDKQKMQVLL